MEMEVGNTARPVGIDVRHVHPRCERAREGVQQTFFGLVDFCYSEDVIDVGHNSKAFWRHQERGCVPVDIALSIDIQPLYFACRTARQKSIVFDLNEAVEVSFGCRRRRKFDLLATPRWSNRSPTTLFPRGSSCWRRLEIEGNVLIWLLKDIDLGCKVSCL